MQCIASGTAIMEQEAEPLEPLEPLEPPLLLHPYRKRKFFFELAALLHEEAPAIRPFRAQKPVREPASGPNRDALRGSNGAGASSIDASRLQVASSSVDTGSSSSVERQDKPAPLSALSNDTSFNDSLQDSLLFLQMGGSATEAGDSGTELQQLQGGAGDSERGQLKTGATSDEDGAGSTALVNEELVVGGAGALHIPATRQGSELVDYFDLDRMCEISPCWLRHNQATCLIHQEQVLRPMLLFCLQALDEFIAWNAFKGRERQWIVYACKLARATFARMWEKSLLQEPSALDADVRLDDFVTGKTALPGVSRHVWPVIAQYWSQYRHDYLHQQELFFSDARDVGESSEMTTWARVRQLLHIYGLKLLQAARLATDDPMSDTLAAGSNSIRLTDQQLAIVAPGYPSIEHLAFGAQYLEATGLEDSSWAKLSQCQERPIISQEDWKLAFNAIKIHLQKFNSSAQVFPCGSFSRGAAFGSVVDVLVATPMPSTSINEIPSYEFDEVVNALISAGIIDNPTEMLRISSFRGVCSIKFKTGRVLLDLKVLSPPISWLGLVYFTGPELFAIDFFSAVLNKSLRELTQASFECIYANVVDRFGEEEVRALASEKHVFDLIEWEYRPPTSRI